MGLFGRDYDRDYGRDFSRGGIYGGNRGRGFESGYRGTEPSRWGADDDRSYYRGVRGNVGGYGPGSYGGGYGAGGYADLGYDRGFRATGYDRGFDRGYDRNYKSQWQTDYGDPFGDRTSHTPMRVIRGEYRSRGDRYDRGWFGDDRGERDYSSNPMGYDPYRGRDTSMERGWGMRNMDRSPYGRDYRGW